MHMGQRVDTRSSLHLSHSIEAILSSRTTPSDDSRQFTSDVTMFPSRRPSSIATSQLFSTPLGE